MLRGWWPDRNPLRRGWDRAEAAITAALIAAFLIGAPAAAIAAGRLAYAAGARVQRAEQAGWHQERAVLLAAAPHPDLAGYGVALPQVQARWAAPHGGWRTGEVAAAPGTPAGSEVTVWVDSSGTLTGPPLRGWQVVQQAALAALLACVGAGLLLGSAWLLARRILDRRRLAAWDAKWRVVGPRWSRRR